MTRIQGFTAVALSFILFLGGCMTTMPDREIRMTRGYVYYLDGAGGGGMISNWSRGLRQGFLDAGYNGAGEMYRWETGLGVVADQDSSVEYKRGKAADCARRIQEYKQTYPNAPVSLIALSAGTAVATYALEALPQTCQVEDVILLGASISANYDMTRALRRVHHRVYVFTSEQDAVLTYLVPMSGTADRQAGVSAAGLRGFQIPIAASEETRRQYAKISYIAWRPSFEQYGNFGGHTDTVKAPFTQAYIAPLIMQANARQVSPEAITAVATVPNPDYGRWARFNPGSEVTVEGYQTINGKKQPVRLTAKLISKHEDRLIVERTYTAFEPGKKSIKRVQHFFVQARIPSAEHPLTSPHATITRQADIRLTVNGKPLPCQVKTLQARGNFPEWGRDITCRVALNNTLPGGVAQVSLKSHKKNQPFEFEGQVVGFRVVP